MMCFRNDQRAAVFIEFALIAPIFFLFFIMLTDVTRYFTTKILLVYSAQQGLRAAQVSAALEWDPYRGTTAEYFLARRERMRIAEQVVRLPNAAAGFIGLRQNKLLFRRFKPVATRLDLDPTFEPMSALVLLPGESALEFTEGGQQLGVWIDHPRICSNRSPSCRRARQYTCQEKDASPLIQRIYLCDHYTKTLLRRYPIMVAVGVKFSFLMPGLKPISVTSQVFGYRERYPAIPYNRGGYF